MNSIQFDTLTRTLARSSSRRCVLRTLAIAVSGGALVSLASCGGDEPPGNGGNGGLGNGFDISDLGVDSCDACVSVCVGALGLGCKKGVGFLSQQAVERCRLGNWLQRGVCAGIPIAACFGAAKVLAPEPRCRDEVCTVTRQLCCPAERRCGGGGCRPEGGCCPGEVPCPSGCCPADLLCPQAQRCGEDCCREAGSFCDGGVCRCGGLGWCSDGSCRAVGGCCPEDERCFQGRPDLCCPVGHPICCVSAQGDPYCCPPDATCGDCPGGCCPVCPGGEPRTPEGCCPGEWACEAGGCVVNPCDCCPADTTCCQQPDGSSHCCQSGTRCCTRTDGAPACCHCWDDVLRPDGTQGICCVAGAQPCYDSMETAVRCCNQVGEICCRDANGSLVCC
jgi:hypothetical protein